ncbi:hypothetical protein [Streptomyces sp. NPDC001480]|uniref:hypothetical protein n=1 Tax=Streptomyces sp. NPDC001480 TaxID=3364577 RepID=UPI00368F9D74
MSSSDAATRLGFQYVGRTTTLAQAAGAAFADLLAQGRRGHPWAGWSFSAGWGSQEKLNVTLVEPKLVVEVGVDVARDASGRWRHPARWHRFRAEMHPMQVPKFEEPGGSPGQGDLRRSDTASGWPSA